MSSEKYLEVYFFDNLTGFLYQDRTANLRFKYSEKYLQDADALALSLRLPLQVTSFAHEVVSPFFAALLPNDDIRVQIANYYGISAKNDFSLLEAIGGECAGAVSLSVPGKKMPRVKKSVALNDTKLYELLQSKDFKPLLIQGELRLSLAGAQNKAVVIVTQEQILLPGTKELSSHILKPQSQRFKDLVQNEFFCMRLAQRLELDVAETDLRELNDLKFLLIKRFDRLDNKRIHIEDFCQLFSIAPENKYQKEAGPSIKQCTQIITQYSSKPALDKKRLLEVIFFNLLIGNNDAHGKNFSLIYRPDGIRLAPFYDLVSTVVYANLSQEFAMKIGGNYRFEKLNRHDIRKLAKDLELKEKYLLDQGQKFCKKVLELAVELRRELDFEIEVLDKIIDLIEVRLKLLLKLIYS